MDSEGVRMAAYLDTKAVIRLPEMPCRTSGIMVLCSAFWVELCRSLLLCGFSNVHSLFFGKEIELNEKADCDN